MSNLKYRREIDGLRALAVLSVLFFHAGISLQGRLLFKGGFLGVDVFFVISGYLITGILLSDLYANRFSLVRFYERRARRILPALFVVVLSCAPFVWLWMTPAQMENFSKSAIATVLFGSNFYFWTDSGYFAEINELKPLLHTWSLAVEEQFYVVFPLLLLYLFRKRVNMLLVFSALILASLLLAEVMSRSYPVTNFYLFPTRAWELLAGAFLAKAERDYGRQGTPFLRPIVPPIALAVLAYSLFEFEGTSQPNLLTAVPVMATMGLIWFTGHHGFVTSMLSSRALVGIGLISYSLYLWHQPIFAFARIYSIDNVSPTEYLGLIAVAGVLAYLTWRFVEQPCRESKAVSKKMILAGSFVGFFVIASAGVVTASQQGFPSRMPVLSLLAGVSPGYKNLAGEHCTRVDCVIGDPAVTPSIALVGDSHAGVLTQSLEKALRGTKKSSYVSANGDMYADELPSFYDLADRFNSIQNERQAFIRKPEVATVILSARYLLRIENTPFDNKEGGVETLPAAFNGRSPAQKQVLKATILSATLDLVRQGKKVVLVYPIPEVGWDVPKTLQKFSMRQLRSHLTTSYEVYRERNEEVIKLFDGIPDGPNVLKIRPDEIFCDTFVAHRCATHSDHEIFYFDDDHLSIAGADLLVAKIFYMANKKWGGGFVAPL